MKMKKFDISQSLNKWDIRYLRMAETAAGWSKDGTKVGCCIVRPDKTLASIGFNGLPPGMPDDIYLQDRAFKNRIVIHAEENAILSCRDASMEGYTMYLWGLSPCGNCASKIARKGIKRVVYWVAYGMENNAWTDSCEAAKIVFNECGIEMEEANRSDFNAQ